MNILIIYNRDIDINDAGASRTTIELANYLAEKEDLKVFVAFKILSGNHGKVTECPVDVNHRESEYKKLIERYKINCVIVPESEKLTYCASRSIGDNKVSIISALHSRPGYERMRLYVQYFSTLYSNVSFVSKIKAVAHLVLFPWFYIRRTMEQYYIIRKAYALSDRYVLLSDKYKNRFVKTYRLNDEGRKLVAIENGLSFDNVTINDSNYDKKNNICLVVGRLDEKSKRLSLLLKIWPSIEKKFPDWILQIVGTGDSEQQYKRLAKKYQLKNVVFEGHQKPLPYYLKSKVFLMTSAYEGFPMTLLEALQTGCVPVAMDTFEAVHDVIINGEDGFITKTNDQFIEKVSMLLSDATLLRQMAFKGVNNCKRFERSNIYEKYYSLIKELNNND